MMCKPRAAVISPMYAHPPIPRQTLSHSQDSRRKKEWTLWNLYDKVKRASNDMCNGSTGMSRAYARPPLIIKLMCSHAIAGPLPSPALSPLGACLASKIYMITYRNHVRTGFFSQTLHTLTHEHTHAYLPQAILALYDLSESYASYNKTDPYMVESILPGSRLSSVRTAAPKMTTALWLSTFTSCP